MLYKEYPPDPALAAQSRTRVGLSPKLYARIARFRRASRALRQATAPERLLSST